MNLPAANCGYPIIGWIMDRLNPWVFRIMGANINRRTLENVRKAGLRIESVEHLGFKQEKLISPTYIRQITLQEDHIRNFLYAFLGLVVFAVTAEARELTIKEVGT